MIITVRLLGVARTGSRTPIETFYLSKGSSVRTEPPHLSTIFSMLALQSHLKLRLKMVRRVTRRQRARLDSGSIMIRCCLARSFISWSSLSSTRLMFWRSTALPIQQPIRVICLMMNNSWPRCSSAWPGWWDRRSSEMNWSMSSKTTISKEALPSKKL